MDLWAFWLSRKLWQHRAPSPALIASVMGAEYNCPFGPGLRYALSHRTHQTHFTHDWGMPDPCGPLGLQFLLPS